MKEFSKHIATFDPKKNNATNRHRHLATFPNLYLSKDKLDKLRQVSNIVYNGGSPEIALDTLASSVIGLLCNIPFWVTASSTMSLSIPVGTIVCGAVSFLAAVIFSHFNWFGDPNIDDAYWTVQTANANYADGSTLNIAYHRGGDRDTDNLGYIGRGTSATMREDLDSRPVEFIEGKLLRYNTAMSIFVLFMIVQFDQLLFLVFIAGSTDDVCVTEMVSCFYFFNCLIDFFHIHIDNSFYAFYILRNSG